MKIEIDRLSEAQIRQLIKKIDKYTKSIDRKTNRLVKVLAEDGGNACADAYGTMAEVDVIHETNESKIIGHGKAVVFAEFGAGQTVADYEFSAKMPFDVEPGSYSRDEGSGEFWETSKHGTDLASGYWHLGKTKMEYVIPRRGMMIAEETIRDNLEERAVEVFKVD